VLTFAVRGVRRGLAPGLLDLAGIVVSFALSLAGHRGLAPVLARIGGLDGYAADFAAFFTLFFLVSALITLLNATVVPLLHGRTESRKSKRIEHVLGVVPGAIQGCVIIIMLATAVGLLPVPAIVAVQSRNSLLTPLLEGLSTRFAPTVERQLALDSRSVFLRVHAPGDAEQVNLHFPERLAVTPDPTAEVRMLALVNQERVSNGLGPLAMDEKLRDAARTHSAEMFELSYISHVSPRSGKPADRLKAAGIRFLLAGENLAYQPDVITAHQQLMSTPGHRSNVLSPLYERVGIGVVRSESYGQMYTQEFAD